MYHSDHNARFIEFVIFCMNFFTGKKLLTHKCMQYNATGFDSYLSLSKQCSQLVFR